MFASLASRASTLTFERLSTALLLLVVALIACLMPAQTDTWWQLRAGEVMWSSHRVMLRDEFTHTVAGGYWPNHEWLSQILFYAAYKIGGLPMLTAFCAALVTVCWAVIARLTPASRGVRLLLLGAGAVMTSPAWSLRPQVFSLALVAITLWIIVDRRRLWTLAPVFVAWANLHGGVSLGVVLLAAAVLSTLIVRPAQFRRMAIVALAGLLCTAATPLGFSLWAEVPLSLARLHDYGVMEWQRPGMALIDLPFWIAAAAVLVTLFLHRAEVPRRPDCRLSECRHAHVPCAGAWHAAQHSSVRALRGAIAGHVARASARCGAAIGSRTSPAQRGGPCRGGGARRIRGGCRVERAAAATRVEPGR